VKTLPISSARFMLAAPLLLALAACGSATDASEDALADNVEVPADQAMQGTPAPVADADALAEEAEAAESDAIEAAETAEEMVEADAPATGAEEPAE
jgi:hypothetical protein